MNRPTRAQKNTRPIQLESPSSPGYFRRANANELKPFFGLTKGQAWPTEGLAAITVKGIFLYVLQLRQEWVDVPHMYASGHTVTFRKPVHQHSRLMAVCPTCDRHVSYGRLHQHMASHQGGE
jgi:hypothetical protein